MKKGIFAIVAVLMLFVMAMTGCDNVPSPTTPKGPTEWSYTVTFDKNTADEGSTAPEPAVRTVKNPVTTVTRLPETAPTRPGYIFVSYNTKSDGKGAEFKAGSATTAGVTVITGDMTVYAQWKTGYVVTFNKNTEDYNVADPAPRSLEFEITQDGQSVTVGDKMPADLAEREGFEFLGWNTLSTPKADEEDATKFTKDTPVTNSITVYARWKFNGLTPRLEGGTIIHELPVFEAGTGAAVNNNDGAYKLESNGVLDYTFPTDVGGTHENANNYDYFIMLTDILSGESGSGTGVALRQKGTTTAYGGNGTNRQPWLSNADGKKSQQDVSGAGDTGGLRIFAQSGTSVVSFRVNSITFYKAPRFTVTFDYNDGKTDNLVVTDVVGSDENQKGPGVTSAKWPPNPDRTGETKPYYFLAWEDETGMVVNASTPITANVTFKAKWTADEPEGWMEMITTTATTAPLYAFTIPAGGKLGDYDRVTFKLKASASVTGRIRAWGTFPTTIYTEESFPLEEEGKIPTGKTVVSMQNANDGLLLSAVTGGASDPSGIVNGMPALNAADGWKPYVLDLVGARHATYGTGAGLQYKWEDNATGTTLLAIGIVAAGGASDSRTYFIKDITLSNADGTKTIEALDPRDESLWGGNGKTAFVQQGNQMTIRQIMYYEAD